MKVSCQAGQTPVDLPLNIGTPLLSLRALPVTMAGVKRLHSDDKMAEIQTSPFMSVFETFRGELDEHQDRRERIIKASRDITALSKKM